MINMTNTQLEEMSDDDFEEAQALIDETPENTEPVIDDEVVEPEVGPETVSEGFEEDTEEFSEETKEVEETEEVSETEDDILADTETEESTTKEESPDDTEENSEDTQDFNYETSYNELMKPLKVSGKETQVKSIDDMRNLAMMGMDYSRKMRDIKPLRAVGETLAKAGIMVDGGVDEAALARLIDINNGDQDALSQLIQEKGIDPLDLSTDDVDYTPTASIASEQSIEIADVEKELINRGSVDNVISELDKLDERSKQFFNETPSNLLKLDDDIKNGTYETIMGAVQYEKSVGRLTGMSDMEAYIQLATQQGPVTQPVAAVTKPSVKQRKAAGITKRPPARKSVHKTYDYVNMSDDEFEALAMVDSLMY